MAQLLVYGDELFQHIRETLLCSVTSQRCAGFPFLKGLAHLYIPNFLFFV